MAFEGGAGIAFPGPVWKDGNHYNFIGQGSLFQSNDSTFKTWTRKDVNGKGVVGLGEHSGQWWMPVPKAVDGTPPPSGPGAPNRLVNVGGGATFLFGTWDNTTESWTPWKPEGSPDGRTVRVEGGHGGWWGASGGTDNNGRMMMIGWALPDYHGPAGPGIGFLTRLTGLREINWDSKLQSLVANPVPELTGLRGYSAFGTPILPISLPHFRL